jgi:3-oxoadipate enol-lactonase
VQRHSTTGSGDDLSDAAAHLTRTDDENVLESHRAAGYRRRMPLVPVNGAQLWVVDEGDGPAVLFVHGGLGDSRLWEPQAQGLADRFRCIRYDLRFWGRSESPGVVISPVDDLVGVLDALEVDRAALVGLSLGGGIILDAALAHPDRVWALVHVAGGMSGVVVVPYTAEQQAREDEMEVDFEVWGPLGADDYMRELWQATPDARGVPDGADFSPRPPAQPELVAVPTLVVIPTHDPAMQQEVGREVARRVPAAQLVEVDSDHYLTLREADRVTQLIGDFLAANAPSASTASSSPC